MKLLAIGRTDVGLYRDHNEDNFAIDEELGLYIVCDGMGGHAAGEVASQIAVQTVKNYLSKNRKRYQPFHDSRETRAKLNELVKEAISQACEAVYRKAQSNPEYAGMGTTLTMLLTAGNIAVIGHVGDSRLYLQRQGNIYKLSNDHTLAMEFAFLGLIPMEEAETHPQSHILTRSIGFQPSVKIDTLLFEMMLGDTFLLCSDGLSNSVNRPAELVELLKADDLEKIPERLIELAKQRDGSDNITAIVLRAQSSDGLESEDHAFSNEVQLRIDKLRSVYLFKHLDLKEITQVMRIAELVSCETGELIIEEGEISDSLYITLEGQLTVSRAGQEITVLNPGNHVGEMALLNRRPRTASVRAAEPSRLLKIERQNFYKLLREELRIGVKLLWSLAQELSLRLDETTEQFYGISKEREEFSELPFVASSSTKDDH